MIDSANMIRANNSFKVKLCMHTVGGKQIDASICVIAKLVRDGKQGPWGTQGRARISWVRLKANM